MTRAFETGCNRDDLRELADGNYAIPDVGEQSPADRSERWGW
jgi:endogenous inhibitor of DNA gyrase (YacG/DUF329 family)